jgi:hypothetical protein
MYLLGTSPISKFAGSVAVVGRIADISVTNKILSVASCFHPDGSDLPPYLALSAYGTSKKRTPSFQSGPNRFVHTWTCFSNKFTEYFKEYPEPGVTTVQDDGQTIDLENVPLDGGVLIKTIALSIDPYQRGLMREATGPKHYAVSVICAPIQLR